MPTSLFCNCRSAFYPGYLLTALVVMGMILPALTMVASELTRISSAERSDKQGHVMRFHMESPPDSFRVRQPFVDLIQLEIYKEGIDADLIELFDINSPYRGIELQELEGGIGIDIHFDVERFMEGNAYPDANGKDLLLGLTRITESRLKQKVEDVQPIIWNDPAGSDGSIPDDPRSYGELDNVFDFNDFSTEALKFETIVIDPGHGGIDPGALGYGGIYEKDITLAIALKLGNYIRENLPDIKVVYTRDDDTFVGLEERGHIANLAQGDLFISLHANSNHSSRATGAEVYFLGLHRSQEAFEVMRKENSAIRFEDDDDLTEELTREQLVIYELANIGNIASSEVFAGLTERQFEERALRRSRGVKQAGFMVLYHASMPAVLIESGFISNPQEHRFLSSEYGQNIMASAIFRAVRDYKDKISRSHNNGNP
ncbi:MAG: N-acetylmuramoyl-L-alanine amidase [Balneolales bacterium]